MTVLKHLPVVVVLLSASCVGGGSRPHTDEVQRQLWRTSQFYASAYAATWTFSECHIAGNVCSPVRGGRAVTSSGRIKLEYVGDDPAHPGVRGTYAMYQVSAQDVYALDVVQRTFAYERRRIPFAFSFLDSKAEWKRPEIRHLVGADEIHLADDSDRELVITIDSKDSHVISARIGDERIDFVRLGSLPDDRAKYIFFTGGATAMNGAPGAVPHRFPFIP